LSPPHKTKAWAHIDAKFKDTVANQLPIAQNSSLQPINPGHNAGAGNWIAKAI
jgi:hypothetical protein